MMQSADKTLFFWINDLAGEVSIVDRFMRLIGNDYFILVGMALVVFAMWFTGRDPEHRERNQRAVWCALIGVGFASAIVAICNGFYDRLRPFDMYPGEVELLFYRPTDPSFPSNTAVTAFAFASGIWLGNRRVGYFLLLPAFLVSFARVFIGVHFPFDVLGGALIGIAATLGALLVLRILEPFPTWVLNGMRRVYLA